MADLNIPGFIIRDANVNLSKDAWFDLHPKEEGVSFAESLRKFAKQELKKAIQIYTEKNNTKVAQDQANALLEAARSSVVVPDNIIE